ncbi:MAG: hypothetical protein MJ169_05265 [Treponema sp.]|nr:hypothetical protein [Treponema sp.]
MPGLSQLRKLSEDVLKLGNEPKLRADRGETPVLAKIPADIPDVDDSQDFVLGLPEKEEEPEEQPKTEEQETQAESESGPEQEEAPDLDLTSLLNPMAEMDAADDMPDLTAFLAPEEKEPPKKKEKDIADFSLDDLLKAPSEDFSEPEKETPEPVEDLMQAPDELEMFNEPLSPKTEKPAEEPASQMPDIFAAIQEQAQSAQKQPAADEVPDIEALLSANAAQTQAPQEDDFSIPEIAEEVAPAADDFDIPEISDDLATDAEPAPQDFDVPEIAEAEELTDLEDIPEIEEPVPEAESSFAEPEEADEFAYDGEGINLNDDLPPGLNEAPAKKIIPPVEEIEEVPEAEEPLQPEEEFSAGADDLSAMEDFSADFGMEMPESIDFGETPDAGDDAMAAAEIPSDEEVPAMEDFSMPEGDADAPSESIEVEPPTSGDFGFDAIDTSGLDDFGTDGFGMPPEGGADAAGDFDLSGIPGLDDSSSEDAAPEVFDTSEMNGVSFDAPGDTDFNFAETDAKLSGPASDFALEGDMDSDFEIPGFSDAGADPFDASGRVKAQKEEKPQPEKQKNSLTDAEYKTFKKNLASYPLNVRIAVEDMIVKNEFTDDVIFELIEKVLKKVPARQLASYLEKMLDIQLSVPRDFERRTAEEYEAYKSSVQYQLKNRIIPAVLIGALAFILLFCTGYLTNRFVIEPLIAEKHYKQGYALLENDEYPQSEMEFNEALKHKQKKRWFFKYAEGYRAHKQYDRAELMYKNILKRFNHDKKGGLDYVHMELDELANYSKAENILKREVLDYHINDQDAILLLGDVYLEWATEEDPSKYAQALEQYSILMQLYGATPDYLARMMRYYVRTDNLREVLQLKEGFLPEEKSLSGNDWTEMSGYLMDKLYGELTPSEEYLRSKIEDVQQMLLRAIKLSPENPVSYYNLSRYFIETNNHDKAVSGLKHSIELFTKAKSLKRRDSYKELNTYRLLGEEYLYQREFILAGDTFAKGIELYEDKHEISGLDSDKNVGVMYADMGDINYFISGQLDTAYVNYSKATMNKNDTPSLRYRLGYIDYGRANYDSAINNFIIASQDKDQDKNLMLAMGNAFSQRKDDFVGIGYYQRLIDRLNKEIANHDILLPQVKPEHNQIVDQYMKANNNLAVSKYRIANLTGDSQMNASAIVNLQEALRSWDALTRNQKTMVRLGGTNLAEQNIKYMTHPMPDFEPAIYTEIPRILEGEKILE